MLDTGSLNKDVSNVPICPGEIKNGYNMVPAVKELIMQQNNRNLD